MTPRNVLILAVLCALGCPGADDGDSGADEASSGGPSCEPDLISECTCTDGTMSTQTCMPDGSGYSECECGGTSTGSSTSAGSTSTSTAGTTAGSEETAGGGSTEAGSAETGSADSSGGSSEGPPPECNGSHPLVEGDLRYCERGHCYCGDLEAMPPVDVCYAMEIAEACCPQDIELVCY